MKHLFPTDSHLDGSMHLSPCQELVFAFLSRKINNKDQKFVRKKLLESKSHLDEHTKFLLQNL